MKKVFGLVLGLVLVGCGSSDEEGEEEEALNLPTVSCEADAGAVPTFAQVTIFEKCDTCHGASGDARKLAPVDVDFRTYAGAKAHAEKAASEVNGGDMPPAGTDLKLTAEEKDALYRWALCGTPE